MTTTAPSPFYDLVAEENVVGACLIARSAVDAVSRVLVASDFGSPNLAAAFAAICRLHMGGGAVDPTTVADQLKVDGGAWEGALLDLMRWMTDVPTTAGATTYAGIVGRFAAKRALHALSLDLAQAAADPTRDPGDVADEVSGRLAALDSPAIVGRAGDVEFADLLAEGDDVHGAPVVPGLLAEDDRVVMVAPEGVGKSELARQLVTTVAWGVHPFTGRPIPSMPTLLVDLENPRGLVRTRLGRLTTTAAMQATAARSPAVLWHRPGGIDLRKRADRIVFEDVLRRNRPRLVSLGPVYKAYTRQARETDENVAAEVQAVLDDLRTRYGFALVLEHHAPQASGGVRDLRPFGSSLWLRWPEYGLKLTPARDRPRALVVGRWRGDRSEADWPDELHRGDVWPWAGYWRDGVPSCEQEPF